LGSASFFGSHSTHKDKREEEPGRRKKKKKPSLTLTLLFIHSPGKFFFRLSKHIRGNKSLIIFSSNSPF
jgi:hypothetical protein